MLYIQQPNTGCSLHTSKLHMLFTYVKTSLTGATVQLEPMKDQRDILSGLTIWSKTSQTSYASERNVFKHVECYLTTAAGNMLHNPLTVAPSIVVAWIFVCSTLADDQLLFCQLMSFTWMQQLGTSPVTSRNTTRFPTRITGRHVFVMTSRQFIGNVSQTRITTKIQPPFRSLSIS